MKTPTEEELKIRLLSAQADMMELKVAKQRDDLFPAYCIKGSEFHALKIEQAEADIWAALNKQVQCPSQDDPLNIYERELYDNLTKKLAAISGMVGYTATEKEQ